MIYNDYATVDGMGYFVKLQEFSIFVWFTWSIIDHQWGQTAEQQYQRY